MPIKEELGFMSQDGRTIIHAIKWIPDGQVKAVLQIAHGMVEFIERYEDFANFLAKQGVLVAGNDHLGHGSSVRAKEYYGYFAKKNGNITLIRDIHQLRLKIQKENTGFPYFMLGHSMGSFLIRQYLCCYGEGLAGAVIMGTGYHIRAEARAGMILSNIMAKKYGWMHRSTIVDNLAFGGYNRKFTPARTSRDWLTRDEKIVDEYLADERCQFMFTLNGYYNLFFSLFKLTFNEYLDRMPKDLPVFFVSGECDPVGNFGKGVQKVIDSFEEAGMKQITCRLYPSARHEILNELDKACVYRDVLFFIEQYL